MITGRSRYSNAVIAGWSCGGYGNCFKNRQTTVITNLKNNFVSVTKKTHQILKILGRKEIEIGRINKTIKVLYFI